MGGAVQRPYWHRVFGGIYLFHVREANYAQLIAAQARPNKPRTPPASG
jgi:hypothetical protein